jgi:TM2 domain-containing membrane protein YozV
MKTKFLLLFVALFLTSSIGFASFPVQKKESTETVSTGKNALNSEKVTDQKIESLSSNVSGEYVSPAAGSGKSQVIALILVLLVGGLGIHRFYLGYTWQGIVQLLTLGGCGIWALIDLIRIITGDLKPKDGEYTTKL